MLIHLRIYKNENILDKLEVAPIGDKIEILAKMVGHVLRWPKGAIVRKSNSLKVRHLKNERKS